MDEMGNITKEVSSVRSKDIPNIEIQIQIYIAL